MRRRTPNGTLYSDTVRFACWTLVATWALYVASFPTLLAVYASGRNIAWFALALLGLLGAVMALRGVPGWRAVLYSASGLVIVWSLIYWFSIVDQILVHEDSKTVSQALLRTGQMVSMSFSAAMRDGSLVVATSTFYREILTPVLQVATVLLLVTTRRTLPPNTTGETDARKSGARG